ncbi:hypothetical protein GSI_02216 [Ganoderma sinense ZZ0214-1]|uniref:Transporter n=1 Tax=Ganoderma sinense ZZ0214-1 TaxID=1077348 RepID=A0A2G8SPI9_9APHY|nr:hypothetical protein GSI_02216 [Ganoderma sinense ZZ0214-1]
MFMATVAALVLLYVLQPVQMASQNLTTRSIRVLVTFSTPFIQQFYFLRSSAEGGIRYGAWIPSQPAGGQTSPNAANTLSCRWPYVLFALISTLAFLASAAALGVALYLFTVTRDRFHAQQIEAAYGPSLWLSVAATAVLLVVALNAGCGTCVGGRFGRQPRHLHYTY